MGIFPENEEADLLSSNEIAKRAAKIYKFCNKDNTMKNGNRKDMSEEQANQNKLVKTDELIAIKEIEPTDEWKWRWFPPKEEKCVADIEFNGPALDKFLERYGEEGAVQLSHLLGKVHEQLHRQMERMHWNSDINPRDSVDKGDSDEDSS